MIKSKKGVSFFTIGFNIFTFFFILASAITVAIVIYQAIGEYGIDIAVDVGTNISNDFNLTSSTVTNMQQLQTDYNDFDFPFDLYILALFIMGIGSIFESAARAKKMGIFSFVGMLFIGAQLFLLGLFFVEQVLDWYFLEFFATLFINVSLDLPITTWIFENVSMIASFLFFSAILINQLDIRVVLGQSGRAEK